MLSWEELMLLNKRLTGHAFLKFLNDAKVLPGVITIENFEDLSQRIVVINQLEFAEEDTYKRP